MNDSPKQGRCLCGAVRFTVAAPREIGACHCGMCRRWSGGGPLVGGISDAPVNITAGEALRWHASSSWGERGFCFECGSSLFWRQKRAAAGWLVCAGALPDADDLPQLTQHIFIDDKPAYYDFAGDAPRMTGPEFTAKVVAQMPLPKRLFIRAFLALAALKKQTAPAAGDDQRGGCLCDGVKFRLPQAPADASICHCGQCRRWGGGAGVVCVDGAGARVESAGALKWYRSSEKSERGFCGDCGTPLFWRAAGDGDGDGNGGDKDAGDITDICAGALQDDRGITVSRHIYIDDKPAFYAMTGDAKQLTGAEFEARAKSANG